MIKTGVIGALGKMGKEVVRAVLNAKDMELAMAVDIQGEGLDAGVEAAGKKTGVLIETNLENAIKTKKPDVVLVALGVPMQEKLIYEHLKDFDKGIFVGVGGSFDVISGSKKRAPKIFLKLNLEWLYRIAFSPARWKRFYEGNIKYFFKLKKELKKEKEKGRR